MKFLTLITFSRLRWKPRVAAPVYRPPRTNPGWVDSRVWEAPSGSSPQATKAKRAGQKPLLDIRNIHSPLTEEFCADTQLRKEVEKIISVVIGRWLKSVFIIIIIIIILLLLFFINFFLQCLNNALWIILVRQKFSAPKCVCKFKTLLCECKVYFEFSGEIFFVTNRICDRWTLQIWHETRCSLRVDRKPLCKFF